MYKTRINKMDAEKLMGNTKQSLRGSKREMECQAMKMIKQISNQINTENKQIDTEK